MGFGGGGGDSAVSSAARAAASGLEATPGPSGSRSVDLPGATSPSRGRRAGLRADREGVRTNWAGRSTVWAERHASGPRTRCAQRHATGPAGADGSSWLIRERRRAGAGSSAGGGPQAGTLASGAASDHRLRAAAARVRTRAEEVGDSPTASGPRSMDPNNRRRHRAGVRPGADGERATAVGPPHPPPEPMGMCRQGNRRACTPRRRAETTGRRRPSALRRATRSATRTLPARRSSVGAGSSEAAGGQDGIAIRVIKSMTPRGRLRSPYPAEGQSSRPVQALDDGWLGLAPERAVNLGGTHRVGWAGRSIWFSGFEPSTSSTMGRGVTGWRTRCQRCRRAGRARVQPARRASLGACVICWPSSRWWPEPVGLDLGTRIWRSSAAPGVAPEAQSPARCSAPAPPERGPGRSRPGRRDIRLAG